MEKYFNSFYNLQKKAIEVVTAKSPKNKFLEDYLTIFHDLEDVKRLPEKLTREKFKERIQPLITVASHNGSNFYETSAKHI